MAICFPLRVLVLALFLIEASSAAYLGSQPQASNQLSAFGNSGGNGGRNGVGNGGGFNNNGGFNGGYGGSGGGDPIAELGEAIPGGGVPGQDYPILASVPDTGFTCEGQLPGYYADTAQEAGCQVFHICQEDGRQDSFLCPNGTIFNQQYFVCDWWFNFDCSTAEQFYGLNAEIGKVNGNGNGSGYSNGNGNGLRSASSLQNSYSAPQNGNGGSLSASYGAPAANGNRNGNNGNRNVGYGNNGNGGNVQAPSTLYQSPN